METFIPFAGFYNSVHDSNLDWALESIVSDDRGDPDRELYDRLFDCTEWCKVHEDYALKYAREFSSKYEIDLGFKRLISPKYYNYETDRILCTISDAEVMRLWETKDYARLQKVCKERFTSCDGFISHYKNDYTLWPIDPLEWDCNQVETLIMSHLDMGTHREWEIYAIDEPYCIIDRHISEQGIELLNARDEAKSV